MCCLVSNVLSVTSCRHVQICSDEASPGHKLKACFLMLDKVLANKMEVSRQADCTQLEARMTICCNFMHSPMRQQLSACPLVRQWLKNNNVSMTL